MEGRSMVMLAVGGLGLCMCAGGAAMVVPVLYLSASQHVEAPVVDVMPSEASPAPTDTDPVTVVRVGASSLLVDGVAVSADGSDGKPSLKEVLCRKTSQVSVQPEKNAAYSRLITVMETATSCGRSVLLDESP